MWLMVVSPTFKKGGGTVFLSGEIQDNRGISSRISDRRFDLLEPKCGKKRIHAAGIDPTLSRSVDECLVRTATEA